MRFQPFRLERFFAKYEFKIEYLLSSSDCDGLYLEELLSLSSPATKVLWDGLKLNYTESAGHPKLRQSIAAMIDNISEENIIIAAPEELIFIAMNTLVKSGDHIIVLSPTYQSLYSIAADLGCELSTWELEIKNQDWYLDIDRLEELVRTNTKMLVVNFPNNPTGFLPSLADFEKIISIAQKFGLILFSDEMYRLLEYNPANRLPSAAQVYSRAVALSGLSKSFALPGLRIGWLVTQNQKWVDSFIQFKDFTTICNSAPSEILAIIALENKEVIVQRNLAIVEGNLFSARDFFQKYNRWFGWLEPKAGSICFPRWLGKQPIEEFCDELVNKHGIMIVPGNMFDTRGPHFRIGLGRKNFTQGLDLFGTVMDLYSEQLPG